MKRALLLFGVVLLSCPFVAADSCSTKTLAFYSANPCSIGGITVQPVSFAYANDGVSAIIDPSTLLVSFSIASGDVFGVFDYASDVIPDGHTGTFDIEMILTIPGQTFILVQPTANSESGINGTTTVDIQGCVNGSFPSCSGTLLLASPSMASGTLTPPSVVDVTQHWEFSDSKLSSAGYDIRVQGTESDVPEPPTIALMGSGICLLVGLSYREVACG